ncbi:MAG: hypothetical protein ACLFTK_13080 [Anaerolineales bacterium]
MIAVLRSFVLGGILLVILAACASPSPETPRIPTEAEFATATPRPRPTQTAVSIAPTASLTPTSTQTHTPRPFPTTTASPAPGPTDTPRPFPTATLSRLPARTTAEVTAHTGPGRVYPVVRPLATDARFVVLAFGYDTEGSVWYLAELPDGARAWIAASDTTLLDVQTGDSIAFAATLPPTPTATIDPNNPPTPVLPQGANARITGPQGANLRVGPGYRFDIQTTLARYTPLVIIGRTVDQFWYEVVTFAPEARQGWILTRLVTPETQRADFAVTWTGPTRGAGMRVACGLNIDPTSRQGYPNIAPEMAGAGWVRFVLAASPVHFPSLQAAFAFYDDVIAAYRARGVNILLVLNHQTYGELGGYDFTTMGAADWAAYTDRFAGVVGQVAARYADQVAAYQIWNEVDSDFENPAAISVPAPTYAALLQRSAAAIRARAPQSTVLMSGLLDPSGNYLRAVHNALGGQLPVDAVAIHPYGFGAPDEPSVFAPYGDVGRMLNAYARALPGMPLWVTEVGAGGDNAPTRWAEAAAYMRTLYEDIRANHAAQVAVIIWYAWSDAMHAEMRLNGLVTANQAPKSPIYETFFALCSGP